MNNKYENKKISQGFSHIIGCDEVGRGCLAGPVVASAVILPISDANDKLKVESYKVIKSCGIKDSKLLSAEKREELAPIIKENAIAWSIAEVSPEEIDRINIHNASLLAMRKAVENLLSFYVIPDPIGDLKKDSRFRGNDKVMVVVDGKFKIPGLTIEQEAVVDGDNKILSIASASIIAKVYRDSLMQKLHETYPIYNLKQHKGYATQQHRKLILQNGLSAIHRLSFCQNLSV